MRLSLWQQFSSNHSNSFVVVGQFEDDHQAFAAFLQIRRIIRELIANTDPYDLIPIDTDQVDVVLFAPVPAQIEIFKPFGIVPQRWIDWVTYSDYNGDNLQRAVHQYENFVLIDDPVVGYSGVEPFDRLMTALGSTTIFAAEDIKRPTIAVDLIGTAPDEALASQIAEAVKFDKSRPIPWLIYYGGQLRADAEDMKAKEIRLLAWENWSQELKRLKAQYIKTPRWQRPEFSQQIEQVEYNPPELPELVDEEKWELERLRSHVLFERDQLEVTLTSRVITLTNLIFETGMFGTGLLALLAWMRSKRCTVKIQFKYVYFMAVITAQAPSPEAAGEIARELQASGIDVGYRQVKLTDRDTIDIDDNRLTITTHAEHAYHIPAFLRDKKCKHVEYRTCPQPWERP